MRRADPSKLDLIRWADDRREVDLVSKVILQKLAFFADGEGVTWRKVADLAGDANCSIRTVHSRLRMLEEGGYIKQTGEPHRLKDSTRSVPTYLLQPSFEDDEEAESMCANSAHIADACVQDGRGMCATGCTSKEALETLEVSSETSLRAREAFGDLYGRIEAAYPAKGLGWTDPAVARRALADLLGQGVDGEALVVAAAAYAADPMLKRRDYGPVSLQRWLSEGRYRAWATAAAGSAEPDAEGSAPRIRFAGPEALRAAVLGALGGGFAVTLDRCAFADGRLTPPTSWAHGRLATIQHLLTEQGAELAAPGGMS